MRSIAAACLLVEAALAFTISTRDGQKKHIIRGDNWSCPNGDKRVLAVLSSSGTPMELRSEDSPTSGFKLFKDESTGNYLELHYPRSNGRDAKLIIDPRSNTYSDQEFKIEGDDKSGYSIRNNYLKGSGGECLEYDDSGAVYGAPCSSSNTRQKFSIVYTPGDPEYKPPENPEMAQSPQIVIINGEVKHGSHSRSRSHSRHRPHELRSSHDEYLDYLLNKLR